MCRHRASFSLWRFSSNFRFSFPTKNHESVVEKESALWNIYVRLGAVFEAFCQVCWLNTQEGSVGRDVIAATRALLPPPPPLLFFSLFSSFYFALVLPPKPWGYEWPSFKEKLEKSDQKQFLERGSELCFKGGGRLTASQTDRKSVKCSASHSARHSVNRPVNQAVGRTVPQSNSQSVSHIVTPLASQPFSESASQSLNQTVSHIVTHLVSESANLSVSQ